MTTTVTVKTHDWPVRVSAFPLGEDRKPVEGGEWQELGMVPKHSSQDFHVHSAIDLCIQEFPEDWQPQTD